MRTTRILEGKQREEDLLKASNEVLRYFTEEFSFAELQSCIIEGCKAMFFSIEAENTTQADEYGKMVQASNEALKLLRPFAGILGQTESSPFFLK